jgi:S1-C subfamily serine protease
VGINTAIASNTGGSIGLGFAISIDSVKTVIDSVRQTGEIIRPYIGIRYVPITKAVQSANNLSVDYGALVRGSATQLGVLAGSPAEKAGIQEGDILLMVNNDKIDENNSITHLLQKYKVGDQITVKLLRKGQEQSVTVTLEKQPAS